MKKLTKIFLTGVAVIIGSPFILFFSIPVGIMWLYAWTIEDEDFKWYHGIVCAALSISSVIIELLLLQKYLPVNL